MSWRRWVLTGGAVAVAGIVVAAVFVLRVGSSEAPAAGQPSQAGVADASTLAARFLGAWSRGDFTTAGSLTDDPANASANLAAVRGSLGINPDSRVLGVSGQSVGFRVSWPFEQGGVWTYDNTLTLVQPGKQALVHWALPVIHPKLTPGARLERQGRTGDAVVDRDGKPLLAWQGSQAQPVDAGVAPLLLPALGRVAGDHVTKGSAVVLVNGGAQEVLFGQQGGTAPLTSTLSGRTQATAQEAVDGASYPAILVAIQPSTGDILAVAQNAAAGSAPNALTGLYAPGSTFKIATATAVLERGAATTDTVLPCPGTVQTGQRSIPNDDQFSFAPLPLHSAFAHSCNTTFAQLAAGLPPDALADAAGQLGLNADFDIPGVATEAGKVEDTATGSAEQVETSIGQGKAQASPFGLALMAATVARGSAVTPRLWHGLDTTVNSGYQAPPAAVITSLRSMMREVVTGGTATGLQGSGKVYGKTGTAQFGDGSQANGWFTGYRDDLAFAVLLLGSNSSRPAVSVAAAFLR
ncbi:MAG TPA: penicillin-binding transpeptidase domain-containing protein [Amycolatopsis sp.]|uniref:penicillin-binding transpeptidase domain-containing protein n=1 Tax=Amycolatopsis sp. TaxID=37632 RepID=UPI002B490A28|nr:penicillin-binding transpeptidase domain-containing protein [Amycolatopsis sp.]HKS45266.1 penicillin-binding transpeptidase domain-containing protein [Amycolatopsis sp.]